jgi:hypothetical protein
MTKTAPALTTERDSTSAGEALGRTIREGLGGAQADAVIVFASAQHDYARLLEALSVSSGATSIVGSSSAGEFTTTARHEGAVSALGIRSTAMRFATGLGRNLSKDPRGAARAAAASFRGNEAADLPYRAALVMTDALAGHTDAMVEELTLATGGNYRFFGGGAGDDARFHQTHVFHDNTAISDAVVTLEILSEQPVGVGVSHGWEPASKGFRVTEAEGSRLVSLNGAPAIEAFQAHAEATGQTLDAGDPMPFFLHNIIGIAGGGTYRLRVPLAIGRDGSVACAAAVPAGAIVHIMKTAAASAIHAAQQATRAALEGLGGREPAAALVFDCVATRLRLGRAFDDELQACAEMLGRAAFVGCNTYGQIARAEGQFGGFHNCTAVVCALPQ